MSHTPTRAEDPAEEYELGWHAINELLDRGFSWSGHERNCAFLNVRGAAFADASAVSGLDFEDDARSVAAVDWDHDGDLDLFLTNRTGPRLRFLRNGLAGEGGFLQLLLEGRTCNRDGIGARVAVRLRDPAAAPLLHTRRAGDGYQAQSSGWMHFGLGADEVQSVEVDWPDGKREVFTDVQAGGRYRLVQGSGRAVASTPPLSSQALAPSVPRPPSPGSAARVVLASPLPMPQLEVESSDGRSGSLFGIEARALASGSEHRPLLLQLWASWCAPCIGELEAFTAASGELEAAGLEILALNIEQESARSAAVELLERLGWPHPSGFASTRTVEILDALQGAILRHKLRIPIPSSFLIDGRGNLVAFYLGRVEPEQVEQDLRLLTLDAARRLAAALPFPGSWFAAPPAQSPLFLERAFHERGFPETAREYQPGWIHLQYGHALAQQRHWQLAEEQFRHALAAGPYLAEAYLGLGQTLLHQERTKAAVEAYQQALHLHPDNDVAIYQLGLAQLLLDDHSAARVQIERLRALGSRYAAELESRHRSAKRDR